jgi:transposase
MAKLLVPDDLWAVIAPLLPPARARPKGGRPPRRAAGRPEGRQAAPKGGRSPRRAAGRPEGRQAARPGPRRADRHPVRAQDGAAVGVPARRDGLRLGHELLAQAARLASGGRVGRLAPGAAGAAGGRGATGLEPGRAGQRLGAGERGGEATGPNPTDRGKPGPKRHLVVDARGTPLGVVLTGANRHDSRMLAPALDAIPPVRSGRRGRPRRRPAKLHADKAYDHRRCRRECRARGVVPRIARRGVESGQRLGRRRWVVERTLAWLAQFRRLTIRYERRRADLHLALTTLGCALVCLNQVRRFR